MVKNPNRQEADQLAKVATVPGANGSNTGPTTLQVQNRTDRDQIPGKDGRLRERKASPVRLPNRMHLEPVQN